MSRRTDDARLMALADALMATGAVSLTRVEWAEGVTVVLRAGEGREYSADPSASTVEALVAALDASTEQEAAHVG